LYWISALVLWAGWLLYRNAELSPALEGSGQFAGDSYIIVRPPANSWWLVLALAVIPPLVLLLRMRRRGA
jgi:hypothetical protein